MGALRRLRGGDPSSTSESSLEPPKEKEKNKMVRGALQRKKESRCSCQHYADM